jgi:hypothetical protein
VCLIFKSAATVTKSSSIMELITLAFLESRRANELSHVDFSVYNFCWKILFSQLVVNLDSLYEAPFIF